MKAFVILSAIILSSLGYAAAAPQNAISAPEAHKHLLTDIESVGAQLVAVGKWGNIIVSQDGEQWQQAQSPVQTLFTNVFFVDELNGWAVGHDATIVNTRDGGTTWHLQQHIPELDKPLLDVVFFDKNHGVAVGAYGLFFRTKDGGASWQKEFKASLLFEEDQAYLAELKEQDPEAYEIETSAILPHFNSIKVIDNTVYMVGEQGFMATSSDNGETWQRLEEIYPGSFFAIDKVGEQLIVGGLRGNIFISDDQGESWQQLPHLIQASVNSIHVVNDTAFLFANSGVIFTYKNGKLTHKQMPSGKAAMAGKKLGEAMIIASEAGITKIEVK